MKVTKIAVHAGRTMPDPEHNFASIKAGVTLEAELDAKENPQLAVTNLQQQADLMLFQHLKRALEFAEMPDTPLPRLTPEQLTAARAHKLAEQHGGA